MRTFVMILGIIAAAIAFALGAGLAAHLSIQVAARECRAALMEAR